MRKILFLTISIATLSWLGVEKVSAQTDFWGINQLANLNTGTKTIGDAIAGVINVVLGFLGIIAVGLILYAGFLWMTSQGNADKIQRAKMLMVSAVIGLAIVLSAFVIARFIITSLGEATGGIPGGGTPPGGTIPGALCPAPEDGTTVVVCNPNPNANTAGSYFTIGAWNIGAYVDDVTSRVELSGVDTGPAELARCAGSPSWTYQGTNSFGDNYYQIVAIVPSLTIASGYTVNLYNGGPANPSLGTFEILAGSANPSIACLNPDRAPRGNMITIEGVGFGPAPEQIFMHAWVGGIEDTAYIVPAGDIVSWAEDQIEFNIPNEGLTGPVRVHVGTQTSNPWNLTVECSADGQCASGCCWNPPSGACYAYNVCYGSAGGPVISSITPDNSAANDQNIVTISGSGFGAYVPGVSQVNFAGGVTGIDPSTVNPQCSGFWQDNYITIVVPTGANTGNVSVSTGSGLTSNPYPFTVNATNRPGLCAVTSDAGGTTPMSSGYFGSTAYIWGLGLNSPAGDTYFGDFISPVSTPFSDQEVQTEVPNILGNLGITYRNGETSNPLPFTVLPGTSGAPIINEITEDNGPTGQYITVSGANFGTTPGHLYFRYDASGVDYDADFVFPAQCQNNIWRHDTIIAKVPSAGGNTGAFTVRVERADHQDSNGYPFTKTAGTPGPGLCALVPTNGPRGMEVDAFGNNFGIAPGANGRVQFYNGVSAGSGTIWNNNQVLGVTVPTAAQSGPVVVYNDTNPNPSNPINFSIGTCSNNSECAPLGYSLCCTNDLGLNYCADTCGPTINQCDYGWTFTTESALSIIDRGPVCNDACANGIVWANFDAQIANAFLNNTYFHIYSCGADPSCASPGASVVDPAMDASSQSGPFVDPATGQNYWAVEIPNTGLNADEYYLVEIDENIENTLGAIMGPDPLASWTFGVGYNNCYIDNVNINPLNPVVYLGSSANYMATAYSAPGICYPTGMPLACEGGHADPSYDCAWSWQSDNAAVASIPNIDSNTNLATANDVGNTNIRATATQSGTPHVSPNSNITVINGPMSIVGWSPRCDASCTNALTYIDFNHQVDPAFLLTTYFSVNICANPDCSLYGSNLIGNIQYDPPTVVGGPHRYYLEAGAAPIVYDPDARYRIWVSGSVEDIYNTTLDDDFEFFFSVGEGACAINSVELSPASSNVYIGDTVYYSAMALSAPDACYPSGQPLACAASSDPNYDCSWAWASGDNTVATIANVNSSSNTATAVGVGTTGISASADQGPGPGLITDVASITVNNHNNPEAYDPLPTDPNSCPNAALSVSFTELMNRSSVANNLKLYRQSPSDIPGEVCLFNGSWWCEEEIARVGFFDDMSIEDTTAMVYPREFMATSTAYRTMVYGGPSGAVSSYGMPLGAASMNYDIDGGGVDGYSWSFSTGPENCNISHAQIDPSWDIFFCSTNSCYGDANPGITGNQHEYTTFVYDIRGNLLSADEFQWSISQGLLIGIPGGTVPDAQIEGTAVNQNGSEILTVEVSDSDPTITGTATAQARIDLSMCEGPWPSYSSFPWTPALNTYNYSTYYCQDSGVEGEETLPYINPATTPTVPNPDGVLPNGEHIFLVQPPSAYLGSDLAGIGFGSLAYNHDKEKADGVEDKWYQKLAKNIFGANKAEGEEIVIGCTPAPPINVHVVDADDTHVYLDWQRPSAAPIPTHYIVRRREVGSAVWNTIVNNVAVTEFDDTTVVAGADYEYSVWSWYSGAGNPICSDPGGYFSAVGSSIIQVRASSEQPGFDLIGIRVMGNEKHLSISDWYSQFAPNPDVAGALIQVDGYEALQVGNTTYVAAANIRTDPGTNLLWTNIYIIAHNEGASMVTREIYNQMIDRMKFNINIDQQTNTCSDAPEVMCSSDFDCATGACNSRGLKLRRDTKRLADLLHVSQAVDAYGQAHRSCQFAPGRSCSVDADCASVGGPCVDFYPILESGTFVNGLTTSNWPESWNTNFPELLGAPANSFGRDPISLFNGCPDETMPGGPADPNTCWNEVDQVFTCPLDSLIYLYNDLGSTGADYQIGANFEYDMNPYGSVTFGQRLYNGTALPYGVNNIGHISADIDVWCNASTYSPGPVTNPLCGNGIVEPAEGEECDGGFRNLCDETLFPANWWNERLGGCNLPGTPNECTWYNSTPALTQEMCGGYCGNINIDAPYENCDGMTFDGLYTCYDPSSETFEDPDCSASLCQPLCPSTGLLAARCGDGYWDPDKEQCDASAIPDGLAGWDCSEEGTASCNDCRIICTAGDVYAGECGDGSIDVPYEQCEPGDWTMPAAADTISGTPQYLCHGAYCTTYGGYCGDGVTYNAGLDFYQPEQCDYNGYDAPSAPIESSEDRQYYCGDGSIVDPESGDAIQPCTIGGGWCGDGYVYDSTGASQLQLNMNYGTPESCDDSDGVDTNACTNNCQWTCHINEVGGVPDDDPIEDYLINPSHLTQSDGLLFNNVSNTVDLRTGESATLDLQTCRVSGPVAVDVTIENNESYAGIVFVTDLSGSMGWDGGWRLTAIRDAIAGSGNALDTILDRNPGAMVALVTYDDDINPMGLDTGFLNIAENIDFLKSRVNAYGANGGTNHTVGLNRAKQLLQSDLFEHSIVIFMTDGDGTDNVGAWNVAQEIKFDPTVGIMGDIFSVGLTTSASLRGFLNAVSSSDCTEINYGTTRAGECGGIANQGVNCWSEDSNDPAVVRNVWEQCDPQVDGADCYGPGAMADGRYVECRWTPDSLQTNYFYAATNAADVEQMYADVSGSIPVNTVQLTMSYLGGGDSPSTSVVTNGTYFLDTRGGGVDCSDPHDPTHNIFTIEATFAGNPDAYLRLSNPNYYYCPWGN